MTATQTIGEKIAAYALAKLEGDKDALAKFDQETTLTWGAMSLADQTKLMLVAGQLVTAREQAVKRATGRMQ